MDGKILIKTINALEQVQVWFFHRKLHVSSNLCFHCRACCKSMGEGPVGNEDRSSGLSSGKTATASALKFINVWWFTGSAEWLFHSICCHNSGWKKLMRNFWILKWKGKQLQVQNRITEAIGSQPSLAKQFSSRKSGVDSKFPFSASTSFLWLSCRQSLQLGCLLPLQQPDQQYWG